MGLLSKLGFGQKEAKEMLKNSMVRIESWFERNGDNISADIPSFRKGICFGVTSVLDELVSTEAIRRDTYHDCIEEVKRWHAAGSSKAPSSVNADSNSSDNSPPSS